MSDVSARYATIAAGFTARVQGCPGDKWDAPSPCERWTARDVVAHVIHVHRRVAASLDGSNASAPSADEDIMAAWHDASAAVQAALADQSRLSQVVGGRFGDMTFEQLVGGLLCADTLIHTWDLARATGQDERLNAETAKAAMEFLTPLDNRLRVSGGFKPKVEPPDGADEQTMLLCFAGRTV
jgi:uncharacterized protein (TIGR03086 family)